LISRRIKEKPLQYPQSYEIKSKIFRIKYEKNLSSTAKLVLNSFHNKYIYYAIEDIFYEFKLNLNERDNLLAILYSPIISLQNNFSINFLDIWIREIYINKIPKTSQFIHKDLKSYKDCNFIIIKLFYKTKISVKKKNHYGN